MVRSLNITPVLNGWIVSVGCQTLVFTDLELLHYEVARYYKDPEAVEMEYIKHAVNKTLETGPQIPRADLVSERQMTGTRTQNESIGIDVGGSF